MKMRAIAFVAALVPLLLVPAAADAEWSAVPPAYTGNEASELSYNDQGTLTEMDVDAGLPGGVYHGRSRMAGGVFGNDFELPFLLPLSTTRPDGTEVLVGMDSSHDVHTALRADGATTFALTDEHSVSATYPPAGVSVASGGAALAEWVDEAGHVEIAELTATGTGFGVASAPLQGNPAQQVSFLSVVHPVLDPSGAAVLTWATNSGAKYQLEQSIRASAGGQFGAPAAVGPNITVEPQLVSNRSGDAAAVWWDSATNQVEVALREPGAGFGSATGIGTPSEAFDLNSLEAGVMGDGTVVVTWQEYNAGAGGTCKDGGRGTTLHVETLKPGGNWQEASTGSAEIGIGSGYPGAVLAVGQSTFSLATVLAEDQGTARCGEGTKRVYAWQGAPGSFDGKDWTMLPGQTGAEGSETPAIAESAAGDATVTWLSGGSRHEATTGTVSGGGGSGEEEKPHQFEEPAPKGPPAETTPANEALSHKVTVIAFNVGLGRPETVELSVGCSSSVVCSTMAESAIRLYWGSLSPRPNAAEASGPKPKPVVLKLPKTQLQIAPHSNGKLKIKVPKATMKRFEGLLKKKGAKALLEVKLHVNGVLQKKGITAPLKIKEAKSRR